MSGLGLPILGDDFYPVLTEKPLNDFSRPLQLLSSTLDFTDPVSGEARSFRTRLALQSFTSYGEWAGSGSAASA